MNDLDSLMIYKEYINLIYYTLMICEKYPRTERYCLVSDIKNITYGGMRKIILVSKEYNKQKKLEILNELDVDLKMIKVLIRVSHKKKYIKSSNYGAWSRIITNIGNMLGGMINICLKA